MPSRIKAQARELPLGMRQTLMAARRQRGWSQAELGRHLGLPQAHISGIETGKIAPRFDTLIELVRVLHHDLLLVPRELVPMVQALIRNDGLDEEDEQPLYMPDEEEEQSS